MPPSRPPVSMSDISWMKGQLFFTTRELSATRLNTEEMHPTYGGRSTYFKIPAGTLVRVLTVRITESLLKVGITSDLVGEQARAEATVTGCPFVPFSGGDLLASNRFR